VIGLQRATLLFELKDLSVTRFVEETDGQQTAILWFCPLNFRPMTENTGRGLNKESSHKPRSESPRQAEIQFGEEKTSLQLHELHLPRAWDTLSFLLGKRHHTSGPCFTLTFDSSVPLQVVGLSVRKRKERVELRRASGLCCYGCW